jgi:hypothetical protein
MKPKNSIVALNFILILLCSAGCRKEDVIAFTDAPVIESYLRPGADLNVNIRRQIPFSSGVTYSSDDINNLTVQVIINNSVIHTLQPLGNGQYTDNSHTVAEGDSYTLSFRFDSKDVTAYTYVPARPANAVQSVTDIYIERMDSTSGPPTGGMPDPVEITWDNPDGSYYLIVVECVENVLDPIRDFGDDGPPSNIFRKQPTNGSSEEIRPMEFQYYGTHRVTIYHVLPDYASLYDQNSSSSQNLTNPSTSIINGYGIFTGLNSETLWIEVREQ